MTIKLNIRDLNPGDSGGEFEVLVFEKSSLPTIEENEMEPTTGSISRTPLNALADEFLAVFPRSLKGNSAAQVLEAMRTQLEFDIARRYRLTDRAVQPADLAQEILRRFAVGFDGFEGTSAAPLRGWMRTALYRTFIDARARASESSLDADVETQSVDPAVQMDVRRIIEQVRRHNPVWGRVLEMDLAQLPSCEGAQELGVSVASYDQFKQRARAKFRKLYLAMS